MSTSQLAEVANQVQTKWSPLFTKEFRASMLLGGLINKDYQGDIGQGYNTVRVSQVNAPTGQLLTIGTDADAFSSDLISTSYVDIVANKRAVASYTFVDLIDLQSQLSNNNPEVRESLMYALNNQINTYLYSLVAASTSAPDHNIGSVTDFNASQLSAARLLAAVAKWPSEGRVCLVDPSYMADLLNASTLTSADYVGQNQLTIAGQTSFKRFGFDIFEDNNMKSTAGAAVTDHALIFHKDFMHMVMQPSVQVKISDLHPLGQFGVKLSVDVVFGAKLGISGANKHIQVYNSAW